MLMMHRLGLGMRGLGEAFLDGWAFSELGVHKVDGRVFLFLDERNGVDLGDGRKMMVEFVIDVVVVV